MFRRYVRVITVCLCLFSVLMAYGFSCGRGPVCGDDGGGGGSGETVRLEEGSVPLSGNINVESGFSGFDAVMSPDGAVTHEVSGEGCFMRSVFDGDDTRELLVYAVKPFAVPDDCEITDSYERWTLIMCPDEKRAQSVYDELRNNGDIISVSKNLSFYAASDHGGISVSGDDPSVFEAVRSAPDFDVPEDTIALLDTGVAENADVVGRVSMFDDGGTDGNGHGAALYDKIRQVYPRAPVLSVKVLDDGGRGTVLSVSMGIEYAVKQKVSIINLSLVGRNITENEAVRMSIQKALDSGIFVIGAAGNFNDDASNYLPGGVDGVYTIGACDSNGVRIPVSNYGSAVDYQVAADSTSEAAAIFSANLSRVHCDITALGNKTGSGGWLFPGDTDGGIDGGSNLVGKDDDNGIVIEDNIGTGNVVVDDGSYLGDSGFLASGFPVSYTGVTNISNYDFIIHSERILLSNSSVWSSNGMYRIIDINYKYPGRGEKCLIYGGPVSGSGVTPGTVKVRFYDCVESSDGKEYDLLVTCENLWHVVLGGGTIPNILVMHKFPDPEKGTWLGAAAVGWNGSANQIGYPTQAGGAMTVTYQLVEHGTYRTVPGTMILGFTDLDQPGQTGYIGAHDFCQEGVTLLSGIKGNVFVQPDTYLNIKNNGASYFSTRGTSGVADERRSGLSFLGDTEGTVVRYSANSAFTRLNILMVSEFPSYVVKPSKTGPGTIAPDTNVTAKRGSNKQFVMTADTWAHITRVVIDGTEISVTNPKEMTYKFSNITQDHTIHVEFEKNTYTVRYNANGMYDPDRENGEFIQNAVAGSMADSVYTCGETGTLRSNAFLREGYKFLGWNTEADGSGAAYGESPYDLDGMYSDGYDAVYNMTEEHGAVLDLYAIWEKKLGAFDYSVVSEETGKAMTGMSYALYRKENGTFKVVSGYERIVPDSGGRIYIEGLHWYDYELRCTGVPDGYRAVPSVPFRINYDSLLVQASQIAYMNRVGILIRDTVPDVIDGERAPSFCYRISGTDAAGVSHSYNLMVPVDVESLSGQNRISGIYAGTWTVTPVSGSRYTSVGTQVKTLRLFNSDGNLSYMHGIDQYGGFGSMHDAGNRFGVGSVSAWPDRNKED